MKTPFVVGLVAITLAVAPGVLCQSPPTPAQTVQVIVSSRAKPAHPDFTGKTPAEVQVIVENEISEGQQLEKPTVDAILARGGVIQFAYYDEGVFGVTVPGQFLDSLENDPSVALIQDWPPCPVIPPAVQQRFGQMPSGQSIDVWVQTRRAPDATAVGLPQPPPEQAAAAGEVLNKSVVDAILSHGGVITHAYYGDGAFLATLTVQAVLDLAKDPYVFQILEDVPGELNP